MRNSRSKKLLKNDQILVFRILYNIITKKNLDLFYRKNVGTKVLVDE